MLHSPALCFPAGSSQPPKSHRRHCFQKSISSPADAADKRRTVGKLGYDVIDTFGTKKEELPIEIQPAIYLGADGLAEFVIINLGPHQRSWHVIMLLLCLRCSEEKLKSEVNLAHSSM